MSSFREVLNEELKDPAVRFWWYFYEPIYMWRTVKIRIQARIRRQKRCRKRRQK